MISKIGYTDSYGGLISAIEAQHLTEKGKENQKLRRSTELTYFIKDRAAAGVDHACLDLSEEEQKTLVSLGYTVYKDLTQHVISWKLEDKTQSQSSESSETALAIEPASSS